MKKVLMNYSIKSHEIVIVEKTQNVLIIGDLEVRLFHEHCWIVFTIIFKERINKLNNF